MINEIIRETISGLNHSVLPIIMFKSFNLNVFSIQCSESKFFKIQAVIMINLFILILCLA